MSDGFVASVSVKDASVLLTSVSEPWIFKFVVLLLVRTADPEAVTDSNPLVSVKTAVNVSGEPVKPDSDSVTPPIDSVTLCRACAVAGAARTGGPLPPVAPMTYCSP